MSVTNISNCLNLPNDPSSPTANQDAPITTATQPSCSVQRMVRQFISFSIYQYSVLVDWLLSCLCRQKKQVESQDFPPSYCQEQWKCHESCPPSLADAPKVWWTFPLKPSSHSKLIRVWLATHKCGLPISESADGLQNQSLT